MESYEEFIAAHGQASFMDVTILTIAILVAVGIIISTIDIIKTDK